MANQLANNKALPVEVVEEVVARTDGVPLFLEELMRTVLESGLLRERDGRYELSGPLPPLAIPTTLQDSLMARLDRLSTVKSVAQLAATVGREFAYDLLRAVAPWDDFVIVLGGSHKGRATRNGNRISLRRDIERFGIPGSYPRREVHRGNGRSRYGNAPPVA
jgi:hypothetical protein